MIKSINLAEREESIKAINIIKDEKRNPRFIRVLNTHIKELNRVIGRNVFKKDAVYINSETLWEIMQPVGGEGIHHHHGLTPEDVYNSLSRLRYSKQVMPSYDNRVVAVTDVIVNDYLRLFVVISPKTSVVTENLLSIVSVVTIFPSDK